MNNIIELNNREITNVSGGVWRKIIVGAVVAVATEIGLDFNGTGVWAFWTWLRSGDQKKSDNGNCYCLGDKNVEVKPDPDCRTTCCSIPGINRFAEPGGAGVTRC